MTKADLQMTNHELQARVIELENEIACKDKENIQRQEIINDLSLELNVAREDYATLESNYEASTAMIEGLGHELSQVKEIMPPEHFDDWYKRLHPRGPGSDPDLEVVRQSQYARILA